MMLMTKQLAEVKQQKKNELTFAIIQVSIEANGKGAT